MERLRSFYLSLGSSIRPEANLSEAIRRLRSLGEVRRVSSAWQTHAVGSNGPDFLNISVEFAADLTGGEVKEQVIAQIERSLGRTRSSDKNAPRTIDIDILAEEGEFRRPEVWKHAFVVVPMAELLPDAPHPVTGKSLSVEAEKAKASTWIRRRPDLEPDIGGKPDARS